MLFHSSIRTELARTFGATLVVLITIVMTIILIRTLGQASRGNVNPSEVLMVMGLSMLGYMPILLTLSLFIAIVGTLSRMYTDSEMVIWFSSGRGLAGFLPPLLRFAWPILLAVTVLSLLAWPWANQQIQELKVRYEKRGNIERVAPGRFQESADGSRVFFIDKDSPDNTTGSNVFISSNVNGKASVTSARTGRIEIIRGDRFLMLTDGQRLESPADGAPQWRLSQFEEYGVRIAEDVLAAQNIVPAKATSTLELIRDPTRANQGELGWRLGLAFATVNLVLIALAVSSVNPRAGRSGNLIFALLTFVVYYNLVTLGQTWVASGRASLPVYLAALHGGVLALAVLWTASRHNNWTLRDLMRRPGLRSEGAGP
jgi:lipopolysaccharide export system permease protein